jgi:uncharacterized protein
MRVNIDEIKEAGLLRSWDVPREQIDEVVAGDRAGYRARAAAHVEARLEKIERRVRIAARAKAALTGECRRCLTPVAVDVPVEFELTLVPSDEYEREPGADKEHDKGSTGGSFAPEDAEEETFRG